MIFHCELLDPRSVIIGIALIVLIIVVLALFLKMLDD